ncbi:MAG: YIP1 family protein [Flammeovirgaceae bacterium]
MKEFLSQYFQAFYRPRKAFEALHNNTRPEASALGFISIPIVAYTLMYVFLTIADGAPSVFTPWLNISRDEYYSINRFLLAPSMLLCWVAATAFIQIAARLMGGQGTFEHTLVCISLGISLSMWGALLHDLPMSFLSALGIINARQHEIDMNSPTIFRTLLWIFYSLYFFAFVVLFPLAVRVVHKLNWIRSVTIGVFAFALFQAILLVFNR